MPQDPPALADISVFDYIAEGLQEVGTLIKQYHEVVNKVAEDPSDINLKQLDGLQKSWMLNKVITRTAHSGGHFSVAARR